MAEVAEPSRSMSVSISDFGHAPQPTIRTVCSMRKEEPQQAPPRHSSTGLLMPCQTDRRSLAQRSRSLRTPHNAPDRNYP